MQEGRGKTVTYSIGVDIGSTAAKAAVVRDGEVACTVCVPTGYSSVDAAERLRAALAEAGFPVEGGTVVATGYGRVAKFAMNDKCSAGTGKFLEVMANRMGVSQDELAALARTGSPTQISSMCTVFAESEVISLIGSGTPREDIAWGVIESVVGRVAPLVPRVQGASYYLTGGLCENGYLIERLAAQLGAEVLTEPRARFAGAIGAALSATR